MKVKLSSRKVSQNPPKPHPVVAPARKRIKICLDMLKD
jgi:hypothetical protein